MAQNLTTRARAVSFSLVLLFLTTHLVPLTEAIWLNLPSSGTKCMSEDIQNHVVVLADYYVVVDEVPQPHQTPTVSARVSISLSFSNDTRFTVVKSQFSFIFLGNRFFLILFFPLDFVKYD